MAKRGDRGTRAAGSGLLPALQGSSPGRRLLVPVLLLALVAAAYLPALGNGYIWDDNSYLTENPLLRTAGGLAELWLRPGSFYQYYPLTLSSFWVEYRLWGLKPLGYHATNIALHGCNAVLLLFVLSRLGVPGAALVAGLFALHPVHVESVAWITERKNVLSVFFYLGAALAYLSFSPPAADAPAPRRWGRYALSLSLFAAALLSKTVSATLPAALLLLQWWKRGRLRLRDALPLVPFVALGVVLGLQTVRMERFTVGAQGAEWSHGWLERGLIAGRVVWFYAAKLIWPHPLVFNYPRWRIDSGVWWQYLFPLAAAGTALLLWGLRHRLGRGPLTAFLYFVGTLFPALGFFDVYPMKFSYVADHFQYPASIGVFALVAGAWERTAARLPAASRSAARVVPALVAVTLGALTRQQTRIYESRETLWRATIAANPGSFLAWNNLGFELEVQGNLPEAQRHLEEALRIKPDYADAHYNLAVVRYRQGNLQGAASHLQSALRLSPRYADAYLLLGRLLGEAGRHPQAVAALRRYLSLKPDSPQRSFVLGLITLYEGRPSEAPRGRDP